MKYTYKDGRFFINPLVGCKSNCLYCYINNELEQPKQIRRNNYTIKQILYDIKSDKRFQSGKSGSIISIGSYCDIFPTDENELQDISVNWIIEALELGNPVQIISKNVLAEDKISLICHKIKYFNQLLYSTTITSFKYWNRLEKGTSNPQERVQMLKSFKKNGVPTNLMIKPFLEGITDYDIEKFKKILKSDIVDYCVVGSFYLVDEKLIKSLNNIIPNKHLSMTFKLSEKEILDCTEDKQFKVNDSNVIQSFIDELNQNGVKILKKSSCVNANILGIYNISEYYQSNKNNYCVHCGNCKTSKRY